MCSKNSPSKQDPGEPRSGFFRQPDYITGLVSFGTIIDRAVELEHLQLNVVVVGLLRSPDRDSSAQIRTELET